MSNKIIYLALIYGFSEQWRLKLLPEFITKLESIGASVFDPFFEMQMLIYWNQVGLTK